MTISKFMEMYHPVHKVRVTPLQAGMRLDKFLAQNFPCYSRTEIQRAFELNHVHGPSGVLNKSHQSEKIYAGELFCLYICPKEPLKLRPVDMHLRILYEDNDIIVIDKAAGNVVHPSPGHFDKSIVHGLLAHCPSELSQISGIERPGIVHRLDQFTSGVLLVAKNDPAHRHLSKQFAQRTVQKTYLAIVHKTPIPLAGKIDTLIAPKHPIRMVVSLTQGKQAITRYRTKVQCKDYSVLECFPETGRTHPLGRHCTS